MRDDEGGAVGGEFVERALDEHLRLGVDRGDRLVEDQDRGIL